MTIHVDYLNKRITIGVRDIVRLNKHVSGYEIPRSIVLRNYKYGKDLHREIQKKKTREAGGYLTEYYIKMETQINEWLVTIRGFIDLLKFDNDHILIEEIKSCFLPNFTGSSTDERIQAFVEQLRIYGYLMTLREPNKTIRLVLIINNRYDNSTYNLSISMNINNEKKLIKKRIEKILEKQSLRQIRTSKKRGSLENLYFPHTFRKYQKQIIADIDKVLEEKINVIIEAPSGLGKTVVSLYPLLSKTIEENKKCFFLTAKDTQREGVRRTLNLFVDQGVYFLAIILKAKEKICPNNIYFCHSDYCIFLRNHSRNPPTQLLQTLIDQGGVVHANEIQEYAKATKSFCPFEFMLDLSLEADIIVGDYNHVFDPKSKLQRFFSKEENSEGKYFLIIDEGHNLLDRSLNYYSASLRLEDIQKFKQKITLLNKEYSEMDFPVDLAIRAFSIIKKARIEHGLNSETIEISIPNNLSNHLLILLDDYERSLAKYFSYLINNGLYWHEDPIIDFYYILKDFTTTTVLATKSPEIFSLLFNSKDNELTFLCKDSSPFLSDYYHFFSTTLLISATITPFYFYRQLLGLPVDKTVFFQYGTPFDEEKRKVLIINDVDTRYEHREHYYEKTAEIINQIYSIKPGRYFVFVPSFHYLEKLSEFLQKHNILILEQQITMTPDDRKQYVDIIESNPKIILLAVTGGIFSEGVDFPSLLNGVIIISPSLPAYTIERQLMLRYYDNKFGNGFDYAYKFPGLTKSFQAAGRLIRTEKDRGIIVFIGKRYSQPSYINYFPCYWYKESPYELIKPDPINEIKLFWKNMK